jgi:hypothetical protein
MTRLAQRHQIRLIMRPAISQSLDVMHLIGWLMTILALTPRIGIQEMLS